MAPHDPDVAQKVKVAYADMEEAYAALLRKAQGRGELDCTHDPQQLARFLLATLVSLRVLARTSADRETLQDIARTALSVFH